MCVSLGAAFGGPFRVRVQRGGRAGRRRFGGSFRRGPRRAADFSLRSGENLRLVNGFGASPRAMGGSEGKSRGRATSQGRGEARNAVEGGKNCSSGARFRGQKAKSMCKTTVDRGWADPLYEVPPVGRRVFQSADGLCSASGSGLCQSWLYMEPASSARGGRRRAGCRTPCSRQGTGRSCDRASRLAFSANMMRTVMDKKRWFLSGFPARRGPSLARCGQCSSETPGRRQGRFPYPQTEIEKPLAFVQSLPTFLLNQDRRRLDWSARARLRPRASEGLAHQAEKSFPKRPIEGGSARGLANMSSYQSWFNRDGMPFSTK